MALSSLGPCLLDCTYVPCVTMTSTWDAEAQTQEFLHTGQALHQLNYILTHDTLYPRGLGVEATVSQHLLALHPVSNYSFQVLKFQPVDEPIQVKGNSEGHDNSAHSSVLGVLEFLAVVTLEEGISIEKLHLYKGAAGRQACGAFS